LRPGQRRAAILDEHPPAETVDGRKTSGRVAEDHSVYEGQVGVFIIDAPPIATNAALKDRYPGNDHRTRSRTQVKNPVNSVAIDDGLAGPRPGDGQGVRK